MLSVITFAIHKKDTPIIFCLDITVSPYAQEMEITFGVGCERY